MPELFLAMDARLEWTQMTNPFGGNPGGKKEMLKPSTVAAKLRQALTGRQDR
jgi:hypothetical protein